MSIDVQAVKDRVDIVGVVERYVTLKKSGARYIGLCPFHAEKTPSFVVYPDTQSWHCFGGCQDGGDVISFVMKADGVDFKEAVERLNPTLTLPTSGEGTRHARPKREERQAPSSEWQEKAWEVVAYAEKMLWSEEGARARAYLNEQRGLRDGIIRTARLGYVPGHYQQWSMVAGLSVPCGIIIPHIIDTQVWGLKVRRGGGEIRYQQVAGGVPVLYRVGQVRHGIPVIIDEGEFNALVIAQATNRVNALALGSASNVKVVSEWLERLMFAPRVWVRMDENRAGKQALGSLLGMSDRFRAVGIPGGYGDPNDLWLGDKSLFWEWIRQWEN